MAIAGTIDMSGAANAQKRPQSFAGACYTLEIQSEQPVSDRPGVAQPPVAVLLQP